MNLNDILEIGTLYNTKIEDIGRKLAEYEKVLVNSNTKIYKNQKLLLEDFKNTHPNFDIKLEDGVLKVNKKNRGENENNN